MDSLTLNPNPKPYQYIPASVTVYQLPQPGETKKNTTKNEDDNEIKDLLILDQEEVNNEINNQSSDIESSIIKKIQ